MKKLIGQYKNGNYFVLMFEDGTKIRVNNEDSLIADFPESIDCKITNACDMGCAMCHEQSVLNGSHANLNHSIFDSLNPYTELAIGGGNVFEHPDLFPFLVRMKEQKVVCNITVHLNHFLKLYSYIRYLQEEGYIHGIGVSINRAVYDNSVIDRLKSVKNLVIHTIAGIMPTEGFERLYDKKFKLLILGYKVYGRGEQHIKQNASIYGKIDKLHDNLKDMISHFELVSFDNLALKQLKVKDIVSKEMWENCYMGDDGQYTMYIDMVKEQYAVSSTSKRADIGDCTSIDKLLKQLKDGTGGCQ